MLVQLSSMPHPIAIHIHEGGDVNEKSKASEPKLVLRDVNFYYGRAQALFKVNITVPKNQVTAFIGPSGCGKSTLLRCLNRLNDLVEGARLDGTILLDGVDLYSSQVDVTDLRTRVGMVFQKSNPFPKPIYDNVAYGPRLQGIRTRADLDPIVEQSLRGAGLWDEVKDRLWESALGLSGGQQQRLCIARALAVKPHVLLMDEPCSALDPIATGRIEELLFALKDALTIVIVTHNMQQAARVLLRLRQPAARDLRFITTAMKISTELERISDLAENICERAIELNEEPQLKPYIDIPRMANWALQMVKESLDAFVSGDSDLARRVCANDDFVDDLTHQLFRELLSFMLENPQTITRAIRITFIAKYLERIADHATNVAELVVYMVEGKIIRHTLG